LIVVAVVVVAADVKIDLAVGQQVHTLPVFFRQIMCDRVWPHIDDTTRDVTSFFTLFFIFTSDVLLLEPRHHHLFF